jgi:hypothetical protein
MKVSAASVGITLIAGMKMKMKKYVEIVEKIGTMVEMMCGVAILVAGDSTSMGLNMLNTHYIWVLS